MTDIAHHIPEALLASYVSGTLAQPFALVVAAHVSICEECRANLAAHEAVGGALLDAFDPISITDDLRNRVMAGLDDDIVPEPVRPRGDNTYPTPVLEALGSKPPKWRSLGPGAKQCILNAGKDGSVRLLYIAPGFAVPDHTHGGLELTLVLQGAFKDETGRFARGDLEVADDTLEHTPVAEEGLPCICLAATDAPLKFSAFVPRLLQPLFRI
ncbi:MULTISPECIES: ChrR family anti-sigma-E factor [Pacificibacter]|uniref:ChrR family anti-sigma-E factor n=1 Tax=Pacificibacter TaxID=1042323 RepID=UPI001C093569|nr:MULTISPECIES: ChrR family anti-sigma-E factor [Pacificibacter]MBU2937512.1 ChrR family anti-sigma-E factor [Pacificibacter marinus]MDO6615692.1 ChrR family anti-sigma-E factor [Pacificibacter sp. 1_MG-2023]